MTEPAQLLLSVGIIWAAPVHALSRSERGMRKVPVISANKVCKKKKILKKNLRLKKIV